MEKLISGIIGLIAGVIGSLIAPWAQWAVKKCAIRQKRRIEIVEKWKSIMNNENFDRRNLLNDFSYFTLRPLLTEKVRKEIERPENHLTVVICGSPIDNDNGLISKEIDRIEKEWKLI